MADVAQRIAALRARVETSRGEVARLEGIKETTEASLATAREAVVNVGLDPDGDLDAQLATREREISVELEGVETDVQALDRELERIGS